MDGNEHRYDTRGTDLDTDQKATDMSERKYGGRGGTLADMLWVENYINEHGYESYAALRDAVGAEMAQQDADRAERDAERDAEHAAYVDQYGEPVQDDDLAWDQPERPSYGTRYPQADTAWDTAVGVAYREVVMDYGNDGRPEDDRHLTDEERTRRSDAVTVISQTTGLPEGDVRRDVQDAAWNHGQSDDYSTHLHAPNWDQLTEMHRQNSYNGAFDDIYQDRVGYYQVALGTEAQKIYNEQFDHDYYGDIIGDGQAEDSYSDQMWAHAQGVAASRLAERGIYHPDHWDELATEAYETNAQLDQTRAEAHELDAEAGQLRQEHDLQQIEEERYPAGLTPQEALSVEITDEQAAAWLAIHENAWRENAVEYGSYENVYGPSPTGPAPAETPLTEDQVSEMATSWPEMPGEGEPDPDETYRGDPGDEAAMAEAEFLTQSQNPEDRPAGDSTAVDMAVSDQVPTGLWASYYEQLAQAGVGPVPQETDHAIARDLVERHPELIDVAESLSDSELLGAFLEVDPTDPAALAAAIADAEAAVQDLINGPRPGGDADGSAQEHELELRGDPAADVGYLDAPADDADEAVWTAAQREIVDAHRAPGFWELPGDPVPAAHDQVYPLDDVVTDLIADLDATPADPYHGDAAETAAEDRADAATNRLGHPDLGESPGKSMAADTVQRAHQAVIKMPAPVTERAEPITQSEATSQAGDSTTDEPWASYFEHEILDTRGMALAADLNSDYTDAAEDAILDSEPRAAGYASIAVEAELLGAEADRSVTAHFVEAEPGEYASKGAYAADLAANPNNYQDYVSYDGRTGPAAWAEAVEDAGLYNRPTGLQADWVDEVYPLDEVVAELIADLDTTPADPYHGDAPDPAAENRADTETGATSAHGDGGYESQQAPTRAATNAAFDDIFDYDHYARLAGDGHAEYSYWIRVCDETRATAAQRTAEPEPPGKSGAADNGGSREWPTEWERVLISTQPDTVTYNLPSDAPGTTPAADAVARAHQAVAEMPARADTERAEPVTQPEPARQVGEVLGDE